MFGRNIHALAEKFLLAYEAKDLATVSSLFHPQIVLRDWNHEVIGYANAVQEFNKKISNRQKA